MSNQPPYNQEQWDELPVPDQDMAWQQMEVLLDKEKHRRRFPFWLWRSIALLVLITGVTAGIWWASQKNNTTSAVKKGDERQLATPLPTPQQHPEPVENKDVVINEPDKLNQPTGNNQAVPTSDKETVDKNSVSKKQPVTATNTAVHFKLNKAVTKPFWARQVRRIITMSALEKQATKNNGVLVDEALTRKQAEKKKTDLVDSVITQKAAGDTLLKKDTAAAPPVPVESADVKKDVRKKPSSFVWSGGVGLQQAIAVSGQQAYSYNYKGKRSGLSDYLPSLYLRLQKKAWFLQADAAFNVPQTVRPFAYSQITRYDPAAATLQTEIITIDKLYYHQFPVSINYAVLHGWSVGAGGVYNVLAGAVSTKRTSSKNLLNGIETNTKSLAPVKGYTDSFLYKTTAGILVQTNYQWKRFSLGLRYTKNWQPFIKYTQPNGDVAAEKVAALQAILRFRLFSSRSGSVASEMKQ